MNIKIFFIILLMTFLNQASANEKKLPICANTPNCVSSQAEDKEHYISPFKISGSAEEAWAALKKVLKNQSRVIITHETYDSLHAEATSLVFHFVDDIHVILDAGAGLIQIRSASRTGHYDFGVNRKRIEALRLQLQSAHVIE